jgi:hypothetical protein
MKYLRLSILFVSSVLFSCRKEYIDGTYIGSTSWNSHNAVEVWTSPHSSHFEVQHNSGFVNTDTLVLKCISRDSFKLEGRVGNQLDFGPYIFNYNDCTTRGGGALVFKGGTGAYGYFQINVTLTINTDLGTATLEQTTESQYYDRPESNSYFNFSGIKK